MITSHLGRPATLREGDHQSDRQRPLLRRRTRPRCDIDFEAGQLAINVDDAGPGVPLDERDAIFERFFRGRAAHDRGMARGTGLGLALVRDHVRAFGGSIHVLESPDGGARFQILLPLVDEGSP